MKKISLFMGMMLIALFSCTDENITLEEIGSPGGGNPGGGNQNNVLQKYHQNISNFSTLDYNFSNDGKIISAVSTLIIPFIEIEVSVSQTFTRSSNKITSILNTAIAAGITESVAFTLTYNNDEVSKISATDDGDTTEINFTYNGNVITGVKSFNGVEESTHVFTLNADGQIVSEVITGSDFSETYTFEYTYSSGNLTNMKYKEDNTVVSEYVYVYDNKINPVYNQAFSDYLPIYFGQSLGFDDLESDLTDHGDLASYVSPNNYTQYTVIDDSVYAYEYQYNSDNYPTSSSIIVDGAPNLGSIEYTYY